MNTMKLLHPLIFLASVSLAMAEPKGSLPPAADRPVDFEQDIKPLFEAACIKCHGKERESQSEHDAIDGSIGASSSQASTSRCSPGR